MEMLPHEHPLTLIDLNPKYPRDEIVYDDEEELIKKQDFRCPCRRCDQEINFYHRYYYTCDQCDYSLHTLCAELPTTLKHESHLDHTLMLCRLSEEKSYMCQACKRKHDYEYVKYRCVQCDIYICLGCSKNGVKNHLIYHPSHEHPLISISMDIIANCHVCGHKHKGNFYLCTTCFNFFAHRDCVFLRKKLLIQNYRKDGFFHTHLLTLAYSFPKDDQKAKFYPRCKVCELGFDEDFWLYQCEKCRYYVHTDCATTLKVASDNAKCLNQGTSAVSKNYDVVRYPNVLHLPFPNRAGALKHFHGESGSKAAFEINLTLPFHRHPLTLVDKTSSIHDSMKMVEVVCNACTRPITNSKFYKCTSSDDGCNFDLHAWCTRLPTKAKRISTLYIYNLKLLPKVPNFMGVFLCEYCDLLCNGFVYNCPDDDDLEGDLNIDVHCALTPQYITHKSHPNHLLRTRRRKPASEQYCRLCLSDAKKQIYYTCETCKFIIHSECALLWPDTISHKYDKHQLTLRYFPVENHSGDYFCEICEEEFNPNGAFYHCDQCVQSIHPACFVSTLKKETTFYPDVGVAQFDNVKFGDTFMVTSHPHAVSLCRGVESDGECAKCVEGLYDKLILKCLQCKFAIDIDCARRYHYSPKPIV